MQQHRECRPIDRADLRAVIGVAHECQRLLHKANRVAQVRHRRFRRLLHLVQRFDELDLNLLQTGVLTRDCRTG